MGKQVKEYPISETQQSTVVVPFGAQIVKFEYLGGTPTIWAESDNEAVGIMTITIEPVSTGETVADASNYVGTLIHPVTDNVTHFYAHSVVI